MVTSATWSNDTQKYTVEVTNMVSAEKTTVEANVMFYAIGKLYRLAVVRMKLMVRI